MRLWPQRYAVASLRALPERLPVEKADGPPCCLVVGSGEASLLAPEEEVAALGELVAESHGGWRAITLAAVFPLDTVGVLAEITRALAMVGVPVMAFSSHDTDHLLVPADLLGRALAALSQVTVALGRGKDGVTGGAAP